MAGKYVNLSDEIIQSEQVLKKLDNMSDDVDLFQTGYNGVGVILSYYKNADYAQTVAELYDFGAIMLRTVEKQDLDFMTYILGIISAC